MIRSLAEARAGSTTGAGLGIRAIAAGALGPALLAACSAAPADKVPPASPDERKALAEAQAMIPASELPSATATATPTKGAAK